MKKKMTAGLEPVEARLVLGVCLVLAAALVSSGTFNFVIGPMTKGLDATESQQSLLRQLPNIGALLVIFLAGVLGPRIGPRRFIAGSAALMSIGYFVLMLAPVMPVASFGLLLGSVGRQALLVVAVTLVAAGLTSDSARATGFAAMGTVTPLVYLVAPILAGVLIGVVSWRAIIALWVLAGVAGLLAALRMLPRLQPTGAGVAAAAGTAAGGATSADGEPSASGETSRDDAADGTSGGTSGGPTGGTSDGELWTPALAGFALTALVQTINNVSSAGWASAKTLSWLAAAVVAALVLVVLMRRLSAPSLNISVLRHGGLRLLLVVVVLVPFTNLWYYFTVGLQTVYQRSTLESSLIMIPVQLAAMGGAVLAGRLITRRGIRFSGTAMLLAAAASMFLCVTQQVGQPLLIPVLIVCLYSGAATGAVIPLTNAIMNLAPRGQEGSASAFRGAAGSLGSAVGVVLMSSLVFGIFSTSLTSQIEAEGGDTSQVAQVTEDLRDGLSSEDVASQLSVPLASVEQIDAAQQQAMVDAYRAQGVAGGVVLLLSALVFAFNRKGLTDAKPAPAAEAAAAGAA